VDGSHAKDVTALFRFRIVSEIEELTMYLVHQDHDVGRWIRLIGCSYRCTHLILTIPV
jgi:hypothetical protein